MFVHIHRTGGSALVHSLEPLNGWRDTVLGVTPAGERLHPAFRERYGIGKHSTVGEIRRTMGDDWDRYRTFSIVRDPVDRAASMFGLLRQWDYWRELPAFARFVPEIDACESVDDFAATAFFQETDGPDRLFMAQARWLDGGVDVLLHTETLADDLRALLRTLDIPAHLRDSITLEQRNTTRDPRPTSDVGRELIRERYAADYDLLTSAVRL